MYCDRFEVPGLTEWIVAACDGVAGEIWPAFGGCGLDAMEFYARVRSLACGGCALAPEHATEGGHRSRHVTSGRGGMVGQPNVQSDQAKGTPRAALGHGAISGAASPAESQLGGDPPGAGCVGRAGYAVEEINVRGVPVDTPALRAWKASARNCWLADLEPRVRCRLCGRQAGGFC